MKQAGTAFSFEGRRYEAGDSFNLAAVPAHLHGSLTRLYGLTDKPAKKHYIKKEST